MSLDALTPSAKLAILSYLAKVFAPGGLALFLIGGISGYALKQTAQAHALEATHEMVVDTTNSAKSALEDSQRAQAEALNASRSASEAAREVEAERSKMRKVVDDFTSQLKAQRKALEEAFERDDIPALLANAIEESPAFRDAILAAATGQVDERMTAIEARVEALEERLPANVLVLGPWRLEGRDKALVMATSLGSQAAVLSNGTIEYNRNGEAPKAAERPGPQ